jgi:hypothetical protein
MTTQPPITDQHQDAQPEATDTGWRPPGFRRGRTGPRIIAGITYALLVWGALRTIAHPVALLFFAAGTGLAIAIWHDYRGLRSRLFAKPGRPWVTSGGLATVGLLAWIIAFGQDNPGGSASGPVADPILQASHAEATALLGEARIKRDAGEFGLALELALQAQAKWPSSAEVKTYLAETGIQATAGMKSGVAQATVAAKAASAQATTEAKAVADADAKEKAAVAETARQARVVADFEAGTANRTAFVDTINKVAPTAGVFIQGAKRGRGDDTVVLVLRNTWHTQPYQIRLQVAQSLLIMWQRIRNDEHSYVTLTDLMDNVVGSTSVFSGISVDK